MAMMCKCNVYDGDWLKFGKCPVSDEAMYLQNVNLHFDQSSPLKFILMVKFPGFLNLSIMGYFLYVLQDFTLTVLYNFWCMLQEFTGCMLWDFIH